MELADFFAIDRLSQHDEELLIESAMQMQQMMMLYESGIREIKTKLDILSDESRISGKPSPIDAIKSRIKSPRSIIGKLKRRGFPITLQSMIAGTHRAADSHDGDGFLGQPGAPAAL